jgi:GNAT superfamily N-acetyltransferase
VTIDAILDPAPQLCNAHVPRRDCPCEEVRHATAVAAVFPAWEPLNNAILLDPPSPAGVAAAAAELAVSYGRAGVRSWALWVPSAVTSFLGADIIDTIPGMVRDTTTLVMQMRLHQRPHRDGRVVRTTVAAATRATDEPVPASELLESESGDIDGWVLVDDDVAVAGAWSHLRGTDFGLYAVGTSPGWRRRGLARALVRHALADARTRGARTTTLQSTPMGEPLYRSLGFDAAGRYEEWVPAGPS